MGKAVKVGDTGTQHNGFPPTKIISGSPDVIIDRQPAARVGDQLMPHAKPKHPPHPRTISSGSSTVTINGKPAAITGGAIGCGGITIGSGTVWIGDSPGAAADDAFAETETGAADQNNPDTSAADSTVNDTGGDEAVSTKSAVADHPDTASFAGQQAAATANGIEAADAGFVPGGIESATNQGASGSDNTHQQPTQGCTRTYECSDSQGEPPLPPISRGNKAVLTHAEIQAIIFNETRSLSGKDINKVYRYIAHTIINSDESKGKSRDVTAPPVLKNTITDKTASAVYPDGTGAVSRQN